MGINKEDLPELLVQPMEEAELNQYISALNSPEGQMLIRQYHKSTLLTGAQELGLKILTEQGIFVRELQQACTHMLLKSLEQLNESFDTAFASRWKAMPDLLCRVLLNRAIEFLEKEEEKKDLDEATPEIESLAREWTEQVPHTEDKSPRPTHQKACLDILENYLNQVQNIVNFKAEPYDYMEVWMHLLLQVYTLGVLRGEEMYAFIAGNWDSFSEHIPYLLETLVLLKGYEELLLPENKDELEALMLTHKNELESNIS